MTNKIFLSTKTYEHSVGLSACFRQWRATHSHCQYLHGYALEVKITFAAEGGLDERNWVMDFGGLKEIKQWMQDTFDHKTLVASDDPKIAQFHKLHKEGIIDMIVVPAVGCERFAELIFDRVAAWLDTQEEYIDRVSVASVEVREHGGNSAICAWAAINEEV